MADGTIIKNTWQIVGEIGAGGMGTVYEVRHVRLGKRYALKQLKQEFADRPDVKHRFDREAMTMAELQHPHIVQVYDIDVEPGFGAFILMDLINGSNLGKIIREQGRRPYSEVLRIGSEIASALDFAHRKGVVHRDIKPGNILIEQGTGRAVLTDFGIAKQLNPDSDETEGTKTGVFVGTYRYSSPEQMRNEEPDPRWDIYSFGIVLYEAYSGNRFLEHMTEGQVVAHVAYMPDWRPNLDCPDPPPDEFLRVVECCLERDRDRRTASSAELVEQLAECRNHASEQPTASPAPQAAAEPVAQELPTAVTQQESYAGIRAALRAEAEGQIGRLQRLEEDLATIGVSGEDWTSSTDLRARLAEVGELEGGEQFEKAMAGLEALGERATEVYQSIEASLRETLGNGIAEVRDRWQSLVERAGDLVPAAQGVELNQLMAAAERCQTSGDWLAGWRGLNEGRPLVERAERNAQAQARARAEASLEEMAGAIETVRASEAETASGLDVGAARTEVAELIEAGRLAEGMRRAESAAREAQQALEKLRGVQQERAAAARGRVERLLGELDVTRAAAVAEDLVAHGREAHERASAAEGQSDFVAAADAYEAALAAFQQAATKLQEHRRAELEARSAELNGLLAQLEKGPETIVGKVAQRARETLANAASGDPQQVLPAVDEMRAEVERAIELVAAHDAALQRQRAAEALQERAARLSVPSRDQRSARQAMKAAASAFKNQRWSEASDHYAQAEAAWQGLVREVEERDKEARETAQRGEIRGRRESLQGQLEVVRRLDDEASRLDVTVAETAGIAPLEASLERIAEQERRGQLDEALQALAAVEEQAESIRTALEGALQAKLAEESAQVAQRWRDVESRAGTLLAAAHVEGVNGRLSSAEQSVRAQQWVKGWGELSAGRELIQQAESAAADVVREKVGGLLGEAESRWDELRRAEATGLVDGFDLRQLRDDVAARMERGLYAQAAEIVESPLERLNTAVKRLHQTQEERLAECRSAVESLAESTDSPEAKSVAGELLERADGARSEADEAAQRGDHVAALAAYETARQAFDEAVQRVTRRRLDELSAQVRDVLEKAPASTAADSVQRARDALEKASEGDSNAALAELVEAREGLDAAIERARAHEEAERAAARKREEAKRRLQELVDRCADLPVEIVGPALERARGVLAKANATAPAAEEAGLQLEQARAEVESFRAAAAQRESAKSEERAVLELRPRDRLLKTARKRMAEADRSFEERAWKQASRAYEAASSELASVRVKAEQLAARTAEGAAPAEGRRSAAGIAAAVAVLAVATVVYLEPWAEKPVPPSVQEEPVSQKEAAPPVAPESAGQEQEKVAQPPAAPAAVPLSIAAVSPSASEVSVPENGKVDFSVELKGGKEGETPPSEWTLGGKEVASNTTRYEYEPDFDAGRAEPYDLTVRFGPKDESLATHSWKVRVEPVNRDPVLVDVSPASGETIREKPGTKVAFAVQAKDPDDDELQYAWTVGGKPAGETGPKLEMKVTRNEQVAVSVRDRSDGKPLTASWNVEAAPVPPTVVVAAIPPFELQPRPASLARLQFKEPATFELVTPKDLRQAKIDYKWTVDGRKVSSARSFRFDNTDPRLVGGKPVRVRVEAQDEKKRSFEHEWKLNILPPAPKLAGAEPPAGTLQLAPGASQAFEIDAAAPVGDQRLTYVFQTNGKETTSSKPRYDFVAGSRQDYTIVASIKDNYGQRSKETRTWKVEVASRADVGQLVEGWLDTCQRAFNQKDVAKLGQLLRLDSRKQKNLEKVLDNQRNLNVAFRDVKIDELDQSRASVSYERVDEFVDERTGKSVSLSTPIKQTFRVENGRAVLER